MDRRGQALIIGGSITGLWAARVLADHVDHVIVIDRDRFPDNPEARRGVPQGRQVHVLLMRGQQILDQLFPGLSAELEAEGVTSIRWTEDIRSYGTSGHWSVSFPFGYRTLACSRLLLEWHLRRRLLQNPKISFVEGRRVTGLLADEARTRVTGVRLQAMGGERARAGEETLTADLIVDASGRESRAPEWLPALGYPAPEETVIDAHVGYATRWYQPSPHLDVDWKLLLVQSRDGRIARNGLIYPIERDRWMVLMVGVNVDLPADNDAYLEFARGLPVPDVYDAIKEAQPLTPIYRYQRTANQMRRYGALKRLPDAFVLMGDAVCAFNPVFGQGMTVGAMEAVLLEQALRRGEDRRAGFALRFQRQVAKLISAPWQLATSEDARNRSPDERVSLGTRLLKLYMDHLLSMVGTDPEMGRAFFDVMHLLQPPATLFAPRVAIKVLHSILTVREPLKAPPTPQATRTTQRGGD